MLTAIVGVLGAGLLGVIGWAFNINSSVEVLKTKHDGLITLIDTRFEEMNRRLDRIERALNGRVRAE